MHLFVLLSAYNLVFIAAYSGQGLFKSNLECLSTLTNNLKSSSSFFGEKTVVGNVTAINLQLLV